MTSPTDTSTPNSARIYDYWLGGTDNFEADRKAAEAILLVRPDTAERALDNKRFLTRAVRYAAGRGIRQFVDIGSGLPTSPAGDDAQAPLWQSTHAAAAGVVPDPMVAYVDYDPVAVLHSRTLLASGSDRVTAFLGDMRDPEAILTHALVLGAGFDRARPACVILGCVLHFVDAETARGIAGTLARLLAAGSYLIISVGYDAAQADSDFANAYNAQNGTRIYAHSWEQITAVFGGLELVAPGIVDVSRWQAGQREVTATGRSSMIVGGVGRLP